jgi:hypothetical protein
MRIPIISIICFLLVLGSCNNNESTLNAKDKDNYETGKLSLEEIEKKDPSEFLSAKGDKKKNLLGQTVVKGKISNSAKIVTYKDIKLEMSFFSKTKALLEKNTETIFENVGPGTTISFKTKYFAPRGSDSVGIRVISAKY